MVVLAAFGGGEGTSATNQSQRASGVLAPAANSQTFSDQTGDSRGGSPDITTIRVTNDDAGLLEFQLALPNRTELNEPDFVTVNLDTDQSAATGCDIGGGFGIDWVLAFRGHTAPVDDGWALIRYNGCTTDPAAPQGSYSGSFEGSTATLTLRVPRTDLGDVARFRFLVIASVEPPSPDTWDLAGELDPWIYEIRISPPSKPRDVDAPRVKALRSTGASGGTAKLRYSVFDESGKARRRSGSCAAAPLSRQRASRSVREVRRRSMGVRGAFRPRSRARSGSVCVRGTRRATAARRVAPDSSFDEQRLEARGRNRGRCSCRPLRIVSRTG